MAQNSIIKIAVLGAESTGKSRLCESLAEHYHTVWVPEFARDYFNDSDIYNYTENDLVLIAKEQVEQERKCLQKASRFLFCDTTLITLKIWAELEFKRIPGFIETNLPLIQYDHYLITDNEVPWEADAQRQNKFSRNMILEMNKAEVSRLQASYTLITGIDAERLSCAVEVIDRLFF
jgi:nicotinamide riboside kinase